mgnify:CR=1 FL=1
MQYKPRAVRVADQLRADYGITEPPINAGLIIYDYPLRVVLQDWNDDISGVFVRGRVLSYIGLNKNHPEERRNFTLWHEFYHFLEHGDVYLCEYGGRLNSDLLEQEADMFAANLLMPREWVVDYFERFAGSVPRLAKRFGVSSTAMRFRLKRLGLG